MARPKITFLPAFFTILAVVFCIALYARIRAYRTVVVAPHSGLLLRAANASSAPSIEGFEPGTDTDTTVAPPVPVQRDVRRRIDDIPPILATTPHQQPAATPGSAAAAGRPAAEKSSLLSRMIAPIMKAVTGSGSHPKPEGGAVHQPGQPSGGRGPTDTTSTTGTSPKDPTSDTQAPRLVAIAFNPPRIHDGEETVLAVQATDDLSGVRSISGTIAAPSGAVQGFALQRELESDRYTAHINIPKDAAEGVWRVNYLSLIDNASNAATLSGANGALPPTASFRVVSSSSDSAGPTLKGVWLERRAMRAGEKNRLFVDAVDDQSGLNLVSGVFISPVKHARIGFVCRPGSGPWECEVTTPVCLDCGDWSLEQLQLQDKANNMTTIRAGNPLVANVIVNITADRCDAAPPVVQTLVLDRAAVSNVASSVINVTATVTDDQCGVMSMSGQVSGPATGGASPRLYFSLTPTDAQTWMGRISVPRLAAKGVWRITWIQVLDHGHNLKTYSQGDPALANAAFNVQ